MTLSSTATVVGSLLLRSIQVLELRQNMARTSVISGLLTMAAAHGAQVMAVVPIRSILIQCR